MGLIERLTAEATSLKGALRTLKMTTPIAKHPARVFPHVITELAAKYGDAPALLSDRERFSYRELAARSNRYSRWALTQGIGKGDTICLLMPGRPEFVALWVGITRAGGAVALLNTNLTGMALAHCINVVTPKHIIVAAELFPSLATVQALIRGNAKIWLHGDADANFARIDREIETLPDDELAINRTITIEDRALYIYTSGTTGMPKAANMNHYRVMLATHAFAGVMDTRATDRMYDCLPLYHTAGGLLATGALLIRGGSVVIREKFSAHEFWDDVVRWDCTCFQYIGELCRYLINSPPKPAERGQRLAVQFRRQGGRGRPAGLVGGRALPDQGRALRRRAPAAGARRERLLHRMQGRRARRGDRQDPERRVATRATLRGLCQRGRDRQEDPARRVQEGRRVVPHRRPHAQGQARLLLFHRPHRRHLPLEGRERLDHGGRGGGRPFRRRAGGQRLRRCRSRPRGPRRHGRDRRQGQPQPHRTARAPCAATARLCATVVFAHPPRDRRHVDLQAKEARPGEGRLRSRSHHRSDLLQRSAEEGLRARRSG